MVYMAWLAKELGNPTTVLFSNSFKRVKKLAACKVTENVAGST